MNLFEIPEFLKRIYEKTINEQQVQEWLEKYQHDRENVDALTIDADAEKLRKNNSPYVAFFSKIKQSDGTVLNLNKSAIQLINATLANVSVADPVINDFQAQIKAANDLAKKDVNHEYTAENFKVLLETIKKPLDSAILAQHQKEIDALEALFITTGFKNNTAGMSDKERLYIKDEMIKELKNTQAEQIKKFKEAADAEIKKLADKKIQEDALIEFLAYIANNKSNTSYLQSLAKPNKQALNNTLGYEASSNGISLLGIKADDIKTFKSASGKTIVATGGGAFSIQTNRFGLSITKADSLAIAMGIRAVLAEKGIAPADMTITITITHSNEESALRIAKEAFEADLEAGFSVGNITMMVNGKAKKADELGVNTSIKSYTENYSDARGNAKLKEKILSIKATNNTAAPAIPHPAPTSYSRKT